MPPVAVRETVKSDKKSGKDDIFMENRAIEGPSSEEFFRVPSSTPKRAKIMAKKRSASAEASVTVSEVVDDDASEMNCSVSLSGSQFYLASEIESAVAKVLEKREEVQVRPRPADASSVMFDEVAKLRCVTEKLVKFLCEKSGLQMQDMKDVLSIAGEYQDIVIRLMMTGRGRGRSRSATRKPQQQQPPKQQQQPQQPKRKKSTQRQEPTAGSSGQTSRGPSAPKGESVVRPKPPKPAPRSKPPSYAVIVKGIDGVNTDAVQATLAAVSGQVDIRVKSLRQVAGGVRVETCSQSERQVLKDSAVIKAAGLTVQDPKNFGGRMVIQGVPGTIDEAEFMAALYKKNGADLMSWAEFEASVRLVSRPRPEEATGIVVLEVPAKLQAAWLKQKRVYVGWTSYWTHAWVSRISCFNCYGLGHFSQKCPIKECVCRKCGKTGHLQAACPNTISCRNCRLNGLADGHYATSVTNCPLYRRESAARGRPVNG